MMVRQAAGPACARRRVLNGSWPGSDQAGGSPRRSRL